MVAMVYDEMAQKLREAGHKLTQPRLAILRVVLETSEYLSPSEIHRKGQSHCGQLGLATVYRTLVILERLGIVRRVHTEGGCHTFARANLGRHYLVCQRCGRVAEFPCQGIEAILEAVRERTGYVVEDHLLELTGVCADCQAG